MDVFTTALVSYLDNIAVQFNEKAIPELFRLNGWDATKTPKLVHDGIDDTNLEAIGKFLKDAAGAGFITPDEGIENTLRDWSGFENIKQDGEGSVMERARQSQKITEEATEASNREE
jgi:cold shock CspA family protein